MNMSNFISSSLFTQSTSSYGSMYSLLSNSMYAKTTAKYAIASKYGNTSTHTTHKTNTYHAKNNSKTANSNETTEKAADFLTAYTNQTKSLDSATTNLQSVLDNENSSTADKVAATQKYVTAYNTSVDFLSDHSSDKTYTMNALKNSLESIGNNTAITSGLGISQNSDGSLKLDTKALTESLTKDSVKTQGKLSALANVTSGYTSSASQTSSVTLLKEQNVLTKNNLQNASGITYNNMSALIKNPTLLKNYYYGIACSGLLMNMTV